MTTNRLKLNSDKTRFIWLGSRQQLLKVNVVNVQLGVTLQSSVCSLGVHLDSQLTMKTHVQHICRTSFYRLRQLRSIRSSLSETSCSALVHAFITSRLDYCNSLLAGIGNGLTAQLQYAMRVAARLVLTYVTACTGILYVQELTLNLVFSFTNVCMAMLLRTSLRCFSQHPKFLHSVVFVRLLGRPRGSSNISHDIRTTKFFCFRRLILELVTRSHQGPITVDRYF
jgi:hypothetical protein